MNQIVVVLFLVVHGAAVGARAFGALSAPAAVAHDALKEWLRECDLEQYAEAFKEYGYEDTEVLEEATEEDIEEAVEELGVKKPHRRLLIKAKGGGHHFDEPQRQAASGDGAKPWP